MINRIKLIVALITVMFLVMSCENSESPNDQPFILLIAVGGKSYVPPFEQYDSNSIYCYAYLFNGMELVNVSSIYVNNFKCENMGDAVGNYMGVIEQFPEGPPYNIHWIIKGWLGKDFDITQRLSNKLDFITLNYLDTISASEDLKILYSGAANDSESIDVQIRFAFEENFYYFDISQAPPNSEYEISVIDNGIFIIPASILSNFEKNRYYSISLTNTSSSSEIINNHHINKQSSYDVITTIYLIP